jgi:RNA polymerase sigma-B factor
MRTSVPAAVDTAVPATLAQRRAARATEEDQRATELVNALAALALSDPGRPALRARVIEAWLPMAHRLTSRYARKGEPFDDLLQTATVGLIKAVDGFDADRGTDFVGYAIPTVLGEIKRYFRDRTWSLRVPRRLQEMRLAVGRAQAELTQVLNRAPTVADIALRLGVPEEAVLEGLEGGYAYRAVSLSMPLGDGSSLELGDVLGSQDHGYDLVDLTISLPPAMARLTERERRIVVLRFYGNQTQAAIAEQIGVSQMHVSRLLTGALAKLRTQLGEAHA